MYFCLSFTIIFWNHNNQLWNQDNNHLLKSGQQPSFEIRTTTIFWNQDNNHLLKSGQQPSFEITTQPSFEITTQPSFEITTAIIFWNHNNQLLKSGQQPSFEIRTTIIFWNHDTDIFWNQENNHLWKSGQQPSFEITTQPSFEITTATIFWNHDSNELLKSGQQPVFGITTATIFWNHDSNELLKSGQQPAFWNHDSNHLLKRLLSSKAVGFSSKIYGLKSMNYVQVDLFPPDLQISDPHTSFLSRKHRKCCFLTSISNMLNLLLSLWLYLPQVTTQLNLLHRELSIKPQYCLEHVLCSMKTLVCYRV